MVHISISDGSSDAAADGGAVGSFVGKSVALANGGEWDGTLVGAMVSTEIMVGGPDKKLFGSTVIVLALQRRTVGVALASCMRRRLEKRVHILPGVEILAKAIGALENLCDG